MGPADIRRGPVWRGYALVALAASFWALSGNLGKYAMQAGVSPATISEARSLVAVACLAVWVGLRARRRFRPPRQRWWQDRSVLAWLLGFGILLALMQVFYFGAIQRLHVAAAILLQYLSPGMVVAFAWLFQRRPVRGVTLVALVASLAGCALVVRAYDPAALSLSAGGVVYGLLSAVTFGAYILIGEHVQERVPVAERLLVGFGLSFVLLAVLNPPWRVEAAAWTTRTMVVVALIGVVGTLIPFSAFMASLRYLDAGRATITSTLEPVIAGLIAFAWFGEILAPLQLIGAALVIGAVVLLQRDPAEREAIAPPDAALGEGEG